MSAENVLSILLSISNISEFIKSVTDRCQTESCFINIIKSMLSSSSALTKHFPAFKSAIQQQFGTQYTLFELLSLILLEFHDHEHLHCNRSEFYCLLHTIFPFPFTSTCKCGQYSNLFPSIKANIWPSIKSNSPSEYETEKHFRTLFKVNKKVKTSECGCKKKFNIIKPPLFLFIGVEDCQTEHVLNFFASVPSNLPLSELFENDFDENYNLQGFLMVVKGNVEYFCKVAGLARWEFGVFNNRKTVSFFMGVKYFLEANALPLGLVYIQRPEPFFIDKQNFMCLEQLKIRVNPNGADKAFIENCKLGQSYMWFCGICKVNVNRILCECGARKNYWKCSCGKTSSRKVCVCGKNKPECKQCKLEFNAFSTECRRCGGKVLNDGKCEVCEFAINEICINCYNTLELCSICNYLNDCNALACLRCMNPFLKLFSKPPNELPIK